MTGLAVDFLRPRRVPWSGWGLLLLGAISLGAALWFEGQWSQERLAFESARAQGEEAAQRAREAALRPVVSSAEELRQRHVAPLLRQPWLPTLRLIENVTEPPVFLLAMSVDPTSGTVRLDGEAPGFAQALAYSQALDDAALLGPAQLRSHDTVADPGSGRQVVHFSIVTRWITK